MSLAYIGLGANLDNPQQQIRDALIELEQLSDSRLISHSGLYGSKPVGPQDQPDYVNAVACLETSLQPLMLLDKLQQLELDHGRIRKRHWGERTLDLDIILFDDLQLTSERLNLPHPFADQRSFVLFPLAEIAPDLKFPNGETLRDLCSRISNDLTLLD